MLVTSVGDVRGYCASSLLVLEILEAGREELKGEGGGGGQKQDR